jgi:hypothetical protein
MDETGWMDINGRQTEADKRWTELQRTSDETTMDVERNYEGYPTKLRRTSNETTTDIGQNRDEWQLCQQWCYKAIHIHELCNDGMQKRKEKCFSFTSCFYLF